jgi:hypothetical protein
MGSRGYNSHSGKHWVTEQQITNMKEILPGECYLHYHVEELQVSEGYPVWQHLQSTSDTVYTK